MNQSVGPEQSLRSLGRVSDYSINPQDSVLAVNPILFMWYCRIMAPWGSNWPTPLVMVSQSSNMTKRSRSSHVLEGSALADRTGWVSTLPAGKKRVILRWSNSNMPTWTSSSKGAFYLTV